MTEYGAHCEHCDEYIEWEFEGHMGTVADVWCIDCVEKGISPYGDV